MKNNRNYDSSSLILSGIFLSLTIIAKMIFVNINIIGGYSPQIQIVFYILGLIFINNYKYKFIFFIVAPISWLMFGFSGNPIFDYLFFSWACWPFIFLKVKSKWNIINLMVLMLLTQAQMFFWNIISGVTFYQVTMEASFIINLPFNITNLILNTILIYSMFFSIKERLINEKSKFL